MAAALIAGQEPVGVALQFQRADGLLKKLEAAGQRIGRAQQRLQRMVLNANALFARQPIDLERHEGACFGDAVDGDVDPGRAFVNTGAVHIERRIEGVAVLRRHPFDVGRAGRSLSRRVRKKSVSQLNMGRSLDWFSAQASIPRASKGDCLFTRWPNLPSVGARLVAPTRHYGARHIAICRARR